MKDTNETNTAAQVTLLGAWGSSPLLEFSPPLFVRPLRSLLEAGHDGTDE